MARRWKKKLADENSDKFIKKDENGQEEFESSKIDYAQLIKALQQYDNEMLEKFFDQPQDEPPVSLSDKGRENLRDTLSQLIGDNRADLLIQNEQKQYQADKKSWQHEKRTRFVKRTVRWGSMIASILIFVTIVGSIWGNNAMAYKLPKNSFFSVVKDKYTKLYLQTDESEKVEPIDEIEYYYSPNLLIEGYDLTEKIRSKRMLQYTYTNSYGDEYYFTQQISDSGVGINTEEHDGISTETLYGNAIYYSYCGISGLLWEYRGYRFKLEGKLSEAQLLKIQESLRKEE